MVDCVAFFWGSLGGPRFRPGLSLFSLLEKYSITWSSLQHYIRSIITGLFSRWMTFTSKHLHKACPARTTHTSYSERTHVLTLECRLHHYLFFSYGNYTIGGLPEDECVKAFLYWVDNFRSHDFVYQNREHLMCPMLWCRASLKDQQETIDHVTRCHWCSSCSRPEAFMNHRSTAGQVPLQRKVSRMKRAMTFFKLFGRRRSIRGKIAWTSSKEAREQADTSRYAYVNVNARDQNDPAEMHCVSKRYEMACSTTKHMLPRAEMSSRLSHVVQHELPQMEDKSTFEASSPWTEPTGSQQMMAMQSLHELCGPPTIIAELPSHHSHIVQHELPQPDHEQALRASLPRAELSASPTLTVQGELLQLEHRSAGSTAKDVSHELPNVYSPKSEERGHIVSSDHDSIPSRLLSSSTRVAALLPADRDLSSPKLLQRSLSSVNAAASRPESICDFLQHQLWTEMATSTSHTIKGKGPSRAGADLSVHNPFAIASRDEALSSDGEFTNMQPLVEELREYFFIVNHEWLQRLAPYEDLSILCSSPSTRNLFELGMNALIQYFNGTNVTSFVDVFALIHVALVFAYMVHKDDASYRWDEFWHDVLLWQYAIVDDSERSSFVRVTNELSTPQGSSILPSEAFNSYNGYPSGALLDMLKNGRVMKDCSAMLVGKLLRETTIYSNLYPTCV